jgi:DNA-binding MarR family transcriptional regulator
MNVVSETDAPDPTAAGAEQPRWLSQAERDAWMPLAGLMIKLPAALDARMQRDAGISHFEYLVLAGLSEATGRTLRMGDLAFLANGSLSRLSHVVKRLEQRGWVRREPCPEDGRSTNAVLTDDGYSKLVASAPGHVETVRALVIDSLTATQLRQLRDIGTRVLGNVDPTGGCGAAK